MKRWLRETHGTNLELLRHFVVRFFDSDLITAPGQWTKVFVTGVPILLLAFQMLIPALAHKYKVFSSFAVPEPYRHAVRGDELWLITLGMSVIGLLAAVQWQSLFPTRRDYLALGALPIRPRQIFVAKLLALLLLASAAIVTINAFPSLAFPAISASRWQINPSISAHMAAHVASCTLASYFFFFGLLGCQGLLLNLLRPRWFALVTGYIQGLVITVMLALIVLSFSINSKAEMALLRPEISKWLPPVWFLGLYQNMLGDPDPRFRALATRALVAVAAALLAALVSYSISYHRHRQLLVEGVAGGEKDRKRSGVILDRLIPGPRQQGVLVFMAKTLARSSQHRIVLMGYVGFAVAIVLSGLIGASRLVQPGKAATASFVYSHLVLLSFLLIGLRHVFAIPAELRANWTFQITEREGRAEWLRAVDRFVMLPAALAVLVIPFPLELKLLGWRAVGESILLAAAGLLYYELLFLEWEKLPFTCSYLPGKKSGTVIFLQLLAALTLLPILSAILVEVLYSRVAFAIVLVVLVACWSQVHCLRKLGWDSLRLTYEEEPEPAVRSLNLFAAWGAPPESESTPGCGSPRKAPILRVRRTPPPTDGWAQEVGAPGSSYPLEAGQNVEEVEAVKHPRFIPAEIVTELWQDIRYGLRLLARSPGFTSVALVSLGLGVAIATCAFSEMNGMVFRYIPGVLKPGELVAVQAPTSYQHYLRYREQSDLFSSAFAYVAPVPFAVSLGGRTERSWGQLVTASYFSTLGVGPSLGSFFAPEQEQSGQTPVVVVSYRYWQEHFASDASAIGKGVRVNGQTATLIGVGPKDFLGASPMMLVADLWMPLSAGGRVAPEVTADALERRDLTMFRVAGRLRPGVSMASAEAELDTIARKIEQDYGEANREQKARRVLLVDGGKLFPLRKQDIPFFTSFFVIMACLVMLIACANVANMMLARAASRRKEIAVRLALGGTRARIVRQLLTESMLVAAGASTLGFLLSEWLMGGLSQMRMPLPIPVSADLRPDGRVLLFTLAITAIAGLVFGLAPALQATRTSLTYALKEGGDVHVARHHRLSLRNLMMVCQVAGSLTLLVILGLLSVGIQSVMGIKAGFNPRNLYLISLDPVRDGYSGPQAVDFCQKLLERVQRLPSITAATLTETVPVSWLGDGVTFSTPGDADSRVIHKAVKHVVGKDYFETTGIPILLGRTFRKTDEADGARAVIVSEALVRELWKREDALGRAIEIGNGEVSPPRLSLPGTIDFRPWISGKKLQVLEVVGVAQDVAEGLVVQKPRPAIYFPLHPADYPQPGLQGITLMVRGAPGVDAPGAVRREISAMDASITPFNARSMEEQIDQFMSLLHMASWTYGLIGAFGLILASVGLAGMTAYSVTQRYREIGIRIALGADRADVLGLVMKEGAALVAVGTVIGMACAWAGSRLLSAMNASVGTVTSTSTSNPVILLGAPLLLAALALLACYVPARRSLRVDPVVALRHDLGPWMAPWELSGKSFATQFGCHGKIRASPPRPCSHWPWALA